MSWFPSKLSRSARILVAALVLSAPVMGQELESDTPRAIPRLPSILLIVADDLGYGDLGCYGQTQVLTPNIDRLAAEGARFTDFYAGSSVGKPSRLALMTGRSPVDLRDADESEARLRAGVPTLAEHLRGSGYLTGLLGRWGISSFDSTRGPSSRGFDDVATYENDRHARYYYTDYLMRHDRSTGFHGRQPFSENQNFAHQLYIPDILEKGALNFIKNNKPDQFNQHRPFFLVFASPIPRANIMEGYRSGNGFEVPGDGPYSDKPWPQPAKNRAAMITRLDDSVGRMMAELERRGIGRTTVVIFTSDNGPAREGGYDPAFFRSTGAFRGGKGELYEGGIRVPLIVRWPERIPASQVIDLPSASWDILPTLVEIAHRTVPDDITGISLLPALEGQTQTNRHEFLKWELTGAEPQVAVRMQNWKAIRPGRTNKVELYDLDKDPSEDKNLAEEEPAVLAQMKLLSGGDETSQ